MNAKERKAWVKSVKGIALTYIGWRPDAYFIPDGTYDPENPRLFNGMFTNNFGSSRDTFNIHNGFNVDGGGGRWKIHPISFYIELSRLK